MGLKSARSGGVGGDQNNSVRYGSGAPNFEVREPAWPEFNERIRPCYQVPARASARDGRARTVPIATQRLPTLDLIFQDDLEGMCRASALPNCRAL